jgi:hypothetical protein
VARNVVADEKVLKAVGPKRAAFVDVVGTIDISYEPVLYLSPMLSELVEQGNIDWCAYMFH